MNEFIVWDKDNFFGNAPMQNFYAIAQLKEEAYSIEISEDFKIKFNYLDSCTYGGDTLKSKVFNTFNYIGKDDIEGNKIYADCSIVEFEDFAERPHCGYGVIRFWSLVEPYIETRWIDVDGNPTNDIFPLKIDVSINVNSFKIIDTIQENKLGLIK